MKLTVKRKRLPVPILSALPFCHGLLVAGLLFASAPRVQAGVADHLAVLATVHAVSGSEEEALQYIRRQLGPNVTVDNTGTVTVAYGSGAPHTLLVAGIDEPGYVVSGLNEEGYLRLERLADPAPHYQFDNFFLGQPVSVRTASGSRVSGSVAAAAVHLRDRGFTSYRQSTPDGLFVDIGARSPAEVASAGVRLLDTVAIEKRFIRLGRTKVSAPWLSSRAGAAVLLELARLLAADPPRGTITLAFASRQYRHQEGLRRVLRQVSAGRVILLQPASEEQFQISAARGASTGLAEELLSRAQQDGFSAQRGAAVSLETGPFGPADLFTSGDQAAVMSFCAAYAGTPAEVVDLLMLEQTGRLLAGFLEVEWKNVPASRASTPASSPPTAAATPAWPLAPLIEQLAEAHGVSRSEAPVRNLIQAALPAWAAKRSFVDERGNLIVNLGRMGDPKALFIAHLDEIGFEVERIERTGRAATKPSGGILAELFSSRPVVLLGAQGPLDAVMTSSGEIDIGANSMQEAEAAGVASGVTVTTPKGYRRLLGSRVAARSLDDRIGCAVLLAALRERGGSAERLLDRGEPVWIMFSVEEELGMLGSASRAQQIRPQRVYPVDSFVTSDSPLEDRRRAYARLGDGFVLRAVDDSGTTPRKWVEHVAALARKHQIPTQYGVTAGGNDGSRFVEFGAVNIPLSWPLRYAHTAAEVADMNDVEALRKIVSVLLEQELAGGVSGAAE